MDVSGDEEHGNHKYMAIVIGTEDCINLQIKKLDLKFTHMKLLVNKRDKKFIQSKLDFTKKDILAFCIRVEKKRVLGLAHKGRKYKHAQHAARTVETKFDRILWQNIKGKMRDFATRHNETLEHIRFQCDADCRDFVRHVGLRPADPDSAHALVDIVAWFNNHGLEPEGVHNIDLTADILKRLKNG